MKILLILIVFLVGCSNEYEKFDSNCNALASGLNIADTIKIEYQKVNGVCPDNKVSIDSAAYASFLVVADKNGLLCTYIYHIKQSDSARIDALGIYRRCMSNSGYGN